MHVTEEKNRDERDSPGRTPLGIGCGSSPVWPSAADREQSGGASPSLRRVRLIVQPTRAERAVASAILQRRLRVAFLEAVEAARLESAAAGRVSRTRNVSLKDDALALRLDLRIRNRHR